MSANQDPVALDVITNLAQQSNCRIQGHYDENGCTPLELQRICLAAIKWNTEQGRSQRRNPTCSSNNAVALLVNAVTHIAKEYHGHQSLRQRMAEVILKAVQNGVKIA